MSKDDQDKFSGKTSVVSSHSHKFTVNEEGNGKTSWDRGHDHKIEKNEVLVEAGHKHELPGRSKRFKKVIKD